MNRKLVFCRVHRNIFVLTLHKLHQYLLKIKSKTCFQDTFLQSIAKNNQFTNKLNMCTRKLSLNFVFL